VSWDKTTDTETFVEWEGQEELEDVMINVLKIEDVPPEEAWWVVISFFSIETYIQKGFPTREEAITEAEEECRIFVLFRQFFPFKPEDRNLFDLEGYSEFDGDKFFLAITEPRKSGDAA
jgi:hypothetical protein